MHNQLFSAWRGELPVADHPSDLSIPKRFPDSRLQVATNDRDYHFIFEELDIAPFKVRFYQFHSRVKDTFTWVSDPMISLRVGIANTHIFQLPQLGKQVFYQRDYNLLHIPHFSVEFSLGPEETVSFMDIIITDECLHSLEKKYPALLQDFVYKTVKRLPAKLTHHNAIASIEILRWADKLVQYDGDGSTTHWQPEVVSNQLLHAGLTAMQDHPARKSVRLSIQEVNKLYRVASFLETFPKKITVRQLADQFKISTYKLEKGFKDVFGYTVLRHAFEEKMRMAFRLIDDKRYNSKQVAKMLRYSVPQSFSRAFRKRFGYAPFRNAPKS